MLLLSGLARAFGLAPPRAATDGTSLWPPCLQDFNTEVTEMLRVLRVAGWWPQRHGATACGWHGDPHL